MVAGLQWKHKDGPGDGTLPGDTEITLDDSADTGEPPEGDWSLLLSAPSTARLEGGTASVTVSCTALDAGLPSDREPLITGQGYADGTLTLSSAGTVEITCTDQALGLEEQAAVTAFNSTVERGWIEAGQRYQESLQILATLGRTGEIDADQVQSLRDTADLLGRMPAWKDSSVPMVPGGYPSQTELEAAGYAAVSDDALIAPGLDALDAALDEYTAAVWAYDFVSGDTTAIEQALDKVELAVGASQGLQPSVGGALAQRQRLTEHLNEHLLPAMHAGPAKVIEGVDSPPFFTTLVDLTAVLGIRGTLIDAMYGPALDWIAVAVDTLATVKLIDAAWAPDPEGPEIWSVNFGGYAIFEGNDLTINGNGFSDQPELNQIIFVHGGIVAEALGIYTDCKDAVDAANSNNTDFFDMFDKMDACVDGVIDALNQEPATSTGTGSMGNGQDYLGVYGDYYFSVGVPPVTYAGPWVDLTAMIPVNLENGLRGPSHGVLLYPPN